MCKLSSNTILSKRSFVIPATSIYDYVEQIHTNWNHLPFLSGQLWIFPIIPSLSSWDQLSTDNLFTSSWPRCYWMIPSWYSHGNLTPRTRFARTRSVNFSLDLWSHRFSQNTNKEFLPSLHRPEILTIFSSYFGRNDDFIKSSWNCLTFMIWANKNKAAFSKV